jgi:RNA polymerase sigma-70 factor (ECF subfamily)
VTDVTPRGHSSTVTSPGALAAPLPTQPSLRPIAVSVGSRDAAPVESVESRARSFRALYEAHVDFVWRNLRRLGVYESDVEDRTQEVFVVAHRRFDQFEDRGHGPRAWLFQIVLRVASDARRHRRRHPEDPDGGDALGHAAVEAPQAEALLRNEALSRLDAALETIDVGRRAVLVLHEIEEMTAPEIAQVLGIPLNTVYSRLRVARTELEEALSRPERSEP